MSESISRETITGRYLRCGSDPMVSEEKSRLDVHGVSAIE